MRDRRITTSDLTGRPSFRRTAPRLQHSSSTSALQIVFAVLFPLAVSSPLSETQSVPPASSLCLSTHLPPSPTPPLELSSSDPDVGAHRRHGRRAAALAAISSMTGSRETVLNLFVLEELRGGSKVGSVVRNYGLDRRYAPEVVATLRFRLLSHPVADDLPDVDEGDNRDAGGDSVSDNSDDEKGAMRRWWFTVGETDGIIRTGRVIDREQLCPGVPDCYVMFDIVVQPADYFQIIKVCILHDGRTKNLFYFITNTTLLYFLLAMVLVLLKCIPLYNIVLGIVKISQAENRINKRHNHRWWMCLPLLCHIAHTIKITKGSL